MGFRLSGINQALHVNQSSETPRKVIKMSSLKQPHASGSRCAFEICIVGFLLLTAGCQSVDPSVELLESELRWQEDQLYLLKEQLQQKHAELESCRRYSKALESERGTAAPASANAEESPASSGLRSLGSILRNRRDNAVDDQDDDAEDDIELVPPTVEEGTEVDPDIELQFEAEPINPPRITPEEQGAATRNSDPIRNVSAGPSSRWASQIVLNSRLTGGYDFDGKPGDEGLLVVIEPRDLSGKYVPLPASVMVEAFDQQERIARWDFDVAETTSKLRTTLMGRGIHLELPWPVEPPRNRKVQVVARYFDIASRRELTAKRFVKVDLLPQNEASAADSAIQHGLPSGGGLSSLRPSKSDASLVTVPIQRPVASSSSGETPSGARKKIKATNAKPRDWSPLR